MPRARVCIVADVRAGAFLLKMRRGELTTLNMLLAAYIGAHKVLLEWTPVYDMVPTDSNVHCAINKLLWDTLHFVVTLAGKMLFCVWILSI